MKRIFWLAVGITAGVMAARWVRRQRERFAPANVEAKLSDGLRDVGKLVSVSIREGRRAAAEKEAELRAQLDE